MKSTSPDPATESWGLGEAWVGIAASFFVSQVIGVAIISVAGWSDASSIPMWGLGILQIPLWAGYIGAVWYAAGKGTGVVRAFGATIRPVDAPMGLLIGVVAQLVLLPILYFPIFKLTGFDSEDLSRPAKELAARAGGNLSWFLFALLVGVIAPVVEELFFRGLLLGGLRKRGFGRAAAIGLSAVIFGALHMEPLQIFGLTLFGIIAASIALITNRLGMSIFAHIGFNMSTVLILYLDYRSHLP